MGNISESNKGQIVMSRARYSALSF